MFVCDLCSFPFLHAQARGRLRRWQKCAHRIRDATVGTCGVPVSAVSRSLHLNVPLAGVHRARRHTTPSTVASLPTTVGFLHMKLSFYLELPHSLCKLGDSDESCARAACDSLKLQYSNLLTRFNKHDLHEWILLFLDPEYPSGLRADLDRFHGGVSRDQLPRLFCWVGGLSVVRTSERSIESEMSRIGSIYRRARHASPAYVKSELRAHEFEYMLSTRLGTTQTLSPNTACLIA